VTHDDPFIIQANITRLQSVLQTETDELARGTIRELLAKFEACAALPSPAADASQMSLGAWSGWPTRAGGTGGAG